MEKKRYFISRGLLVVALLCICYGVYRGEVDTVLSKAIRICLECVGIG